MLSQLLCYASPRLKTHKTDLPAYCLNGIEFECVRNVFFPVHVHFADFFMHHNILASKQIFGQSHCINISLHADRLVNNCLPSVQ